MHPTDAVSKQEIVCPLFSCLFPHGEAATSLSCPEGTTTYHSPLRKDNQSITTLEQCNYEFLEGEKREISAEKSANVVHG